MHFFLAVCLRNITKYIGRFGVEATLHFQVGGVTQIFSIFLKYILRPDGKRDVTPCWIIQVIT
jgi:hypothetical protein